MCATIVWAIDSSAYGQTFHEHTGARLGVQPQLSEYRIVSGRVRPSMVHFTLTAQMCDCDALVGLRGRELGDGEIAAQALVGWVREMATFAPGVSRLVLLRAWSPAEVRVRPRRASGVVVSRVDEELLRQVPDNALLTIDYPGEVLPQS